MILRWSRLFGGYFHLIRIIVSFKNCSNPSVCVNKGWLLFPLLSNRKSLEDASGGSLPRVTLIKKWAWSHAYCYRGHWYVKYLEISVQSLSQRGITGRTLTECKYLSWLIAILSLSPSKAQLRIRLPKHRQDCLYFYSQTSAFFDQFFTPSFRFSPGWVSSMLSMWLSSYTKPDSSKSFTKYYWKNKQNWKSSAGIRPTQRGHRISHWLFPFSYKHESWAELFLGHTRHQSETPCV